MARTASAGEYAINFGDALAALADPTIDDNGDSVEERFIACCTNGFV